MRARWPALSRFIVPSSRYYQQVQLSRLIHNGLRSRRRSANLKISAADQAVPALVDTSVANMSILRRHGSLSQDGSVTAKTIEIREPASITCRAQLVTIRP